MPHSALYSLRINIDTPEFLIPSGIIAAKFTDNLTVLAM